MYPVWISVCNLLSFRCYFAGKIYAMHWANDSKHLVSASQDGKLIVGFLVNHIVSRTLRLLCWILFRFGMASQPTNLMPFLFSLRGSWRVPTDPVGLFFCASTLFSRIYLFFFAFFSDLVACGGLDNACTIYRLPNNSTSVRESSQPKVTAALHQHEACPFHCWTGCSMPWDLISFFFIGLSLLLPLFAWWSNHHVFRWC